MRPIAVRIVTILALALAPVQAHAVDGVIEINQASALEGEVTPGDAPGFPVTISQPGSYVLTGNLSVPSSNTTAILIGAARVTIDLGGFAILGPNTCSAGSCEANGSGTGISGLGMVGSSVHNGSVEGMGDRGLDLGVAARVERVTARFNGGSGISVGASSLLLGNQVIDNGGGGLRLGDNSAYADNVIIGQSFGPSVSSSGSVPAKATGGNVCDDTRCSSGERRYYLTKTTVTGDQPLAACAPGFHMASLFEIFDTSGLRYDTELGITLVDSGRGAPGDAGWIRTGINAAGGTTAGVANCQAWTTTSGNGSYVFFDASWNSPAGQRNQPWFASTFSCANPLRVWCVQD